MKVSFERMISAANVFNLLREQFQYESVMQTTMFPDGRYGMLSSLIGSWGVLAAYASQEVYLHI